MSLSTLMIAAGLAAAAPAPSPPADGIQVERFGLYVLADDLKRATAFYAALFGRAPDVETPARVGFFVSGGLYAVVFRDAYAPGVAPGGSVRPYLKVTDLDAALRRVRALAPKSVEGDGVVREGPFSFFRFSDSEGNIVELFALDSAAKYPPSASSK